MNNFDEFGEHSSKHNQILPYYVHIYKCVHNPKHQTGIITI